MDKKIKLSISLATFNEEKNIKECLDSVKDIADEIVIVDGGSTDKTVEIAKEFSAKIIITDNPPIFHVNKQKAFDKATGDWILNLDADERVSKDLGKEILKVISMTEEELEKYQRHLKNLKLFLRHQKIIEEKEGSIVNKDQKITAFFLPRVNYFLGKFLKYGGVYPDGVIRLFKKDKAYLPCKDVHEQVIVEGRVGWLGNDLVHYDSKTFGRYLTRNSRYIDLMVQDFKKENLRKSSGNFIDYMIIKPLSWFLITTIRNKGILDGYQGLVFSFFSALRFPRAYLRYIYQQ